MVENKVYYSAASQDKLKKIKNEGVDKIHVLTDFDRTITTYRALTSWAILAKSGVMPQDYVRRRDELFNKYRPIELDLSLDAEYRKAQMAEWFKKHIELLIEFKVSRQVMEELVKNEEYFKIRPGVTEWLREMNELDVPVIIISAGVGNFIELFLQHLKIDFPNIHLISNFVEFDQQGFAVSMRYQTVVHVANKDETDLSQFIKPFISDRPNTVLIGDTVDDVFMSAHSPEGETFNIGFLEKEIEQNRPHYLKVFDLVLEGESDFSEVVKIFNELK